ncbi:glycerophosphoryl diester phosphodiesterase [Actinoalloteichus sp. GBA129-24]|uniref:Glycerophosphoryl diester phosphodiesterase n=2 Tax=Pseudonocardiaceae TaxID=2070 RepID=A0AAC9LDU0_9PSEU|nr:glycerophosphoryl diester phosphodiesterase [Actinoalloteichus fjordicus]APU21068.1 glycerophosphoryl diester phosphodiesterase [Actinoalloteichus sp. GBA129-24]
MENSASALARAWAEGFAYLETDVRATADGVVVVQHDATLGRTTDSAGVVATLPWAAVRRARIGGREPVSRLEEVLEALPAARFNIDVKSDQAVGPVLRVVERMSAWSRVCLASFEERRLRVLRRVGGPRLMTSLGRGSARLLWASSRLGRWGDGLPVAGRLAQVPLHRGSLRVVDERLVGAVRRRGLEVHVWTVDDPARMRELLDLGVDGLVTDRPDLLRAELVARGAWPSAR